MNSEKKETRRDFLRTLGRRTALGVIGTVSGLLIARKSEKKSASHTCVNNGICKTCRTFSSCILPQAQSARQAINHTDSKNEQTNVRKTKSR